MKSFPAWIAVLALMHVSGAAAADLRLDIQGLSGTSKVYAALFNRAEDFLKTDRAIAGATVLPTRDSVRVIFADLAPGSYAVSVFQDADGNGKLDRNMMGLPLEPHGFSRDASGTLGPPKFSDAMLEIRSTDVTARITLR